MSKNTQHELILNYMKVNKTITPSEAWYKLGISKLSTRISELRAKGMKIQGVWTEGENKFHENCRFMKYFF